MSAYMKVVATHRGIDIYRSANTHPGCKTKTISVFTEDISGFKGKHYRKTFRYERFSESSALSAIANAILFIDQNIQ